MNKDYEETQEGEQGKRYGLSAPIAMPLFLNCAISSIPISPSMDWPYTSATDDMECSCRCRIIMDLDNTWKGENVVFPEESKFLTVDDKGNCTECDVLFTFDSEETGKSYIAYTDNSVDEKGNVQVFAATYDPEDEAKKLMAIESEKEWQVIEIILEEIQAKIRLDFDSTIRKTFILRQRNENDEEKRKE